MNYLAAIREKNAPRGTDKTDKTPIQGSSVSFGSTPQGTFAEKNETAARLLSLADFERLPAGLLGRLTAADLADVADETDATLTAYLYALADTADREAGRVPPGHAGAIVCAHCGPVFVDPDVARVLPAVNGWPTAAGCPWCHVKTRQFPRPPVQSVTCKHYTPDQLNPPAGAGGCRCGTHHPREQHRCDEYEPQTAQHRRADHE